MNPSPQSERFPRRLRLSGKRAFDRVFSVRLAARDSVLIVHCAKNGLTHSRLGIAASRRLGNAAVRNYWKRLIREAFRRQQSLLPGGLDLVVRPQGGANPDPIAVSRSLVRLAQKLHHIESKN